MSLCTLSRRIFSALKMDTLKRIECSQILLPKHPLEKLWASCLSSSLSNWVWKALPVARLVSAYNPCTVAYSSVVFFLYAFTFQIKRSNRHPTVRGLSCGPGRLRRCRPQMIGRHGNGVSDDALEGSFRAGTSVVVASWSRTGGSLRARPQSRRRRRAARRPPPG